MLTTINVPSGDSKSADNAEDFQRNLQRDDLVDQLIITANGKVM